MPFHIKAVLTATDLSQSADVVVRAAGALAALAEAELHAVHAVESDGRSEESPDRTNDARAAFQSHLRGALPGSVDVTSSHVAKGKAYEVILRRAAEVEADLLVIGRHRGPHTTGDPLGTTADQLVRAVDVPCLIVHEPLSLPLRRILVPSDLSEAAQGAVDVAFIWGTALRMPTTSGQETRLDVVHIASPDSRTRPDAQDVDPVQGLRAQIADAEARTGYSGFLTVGTAVIDEETVEDAILRYAGENEVDLLVLGTHGQSAHTRALVGSVSSAVARRAERPLLLVPPGLWKGWPRRSDSLQEGSSA